MRTGLSAGGAILFSLVKLVPTEWGAPTSRSTGSDAAQREDLSFEDARIKVALIQPRDKIVLDTCGGLGYFEHGAFGRRQARPVVRDEFRRALAEKHQSVVAACRASLTLIQEDVARAVVRLAADSVDRFCTIHRDSELPGTSIR